MKKIIVTKENVNMSSFRPFGGTLGGHSERYFDAISALVRDGGDDHLYKVAIVWAYPDSRPEAERLAEAQANGLTEAPAQRAYLCAEFTPVAGGKPYTISIEFGLLKWRRAITGARVPVAIGTFVDKCHECADKACGKSFEEALAAFQSLQGVTVRASEDISSLATFRRRDGGQYDAVSVKIDLRLTKTIHSA